MIRLGLHGSKSCNAVLTLFCPEGIAASSMSVSTSVAGMTAKPIIDVDIVIEPQDFERTKDRLAEIGYFHEGDLDIPGRDAFDLVG